MGDNYEKQMYFDFSTNTFQEKQLVDWDLSFESTDDGFGIFSNTGYNINIRKANIYNLNEFYASDTDFIMKLPVLVDGSNGKVSTSAIGDWKTYKIYDVSVNGFIPGIYFIELSYLSGKDRFMRLQILNVNDSAYTCKITKLNQNNSSYTIIPKNKAQNFTFYSFKNWGGVVDNAEPPKETWDIEFTKYKTIIPNPPTTILYTLSGVFSNRNKVEVATDFSNKFDEIDANSINQYIFNTDRDAIGYDNWKTFNYANGANGKYTVNSKITYIIKDTEGKYYKLRFLDFYDKQGRRGNPKFEFIRIK
jgi:hypothetical protein